MPLKRIFHRFKSVSIRTKLMFLFLVIIVVPVFIIAWIAIHGTHIMVNQVYPTSQRTKQNARMLLSDVSTQTLNSSIHFLDIQAQRYIEQISRKVANEIAEFLNDRDEDIRYLAAIPPSEKSFRSFLLMKESSIIVSPQYLYDERLHIWMSEQSSSNQPDSMRAELPQNEKDFRHVPHASRDLIEVPIYKEITFFDIRGQEKIKISDLDHKLRDISIKRNTYVGSEVYFDRIQHLKKNDIYVSEVIGAYVGSYIRDTYSKPSAFNAGIPFNPSLSAFAGVENPMGKRFRGVIRFVTPVFEVNKKIGYISLALDYIHIQQMVDYLSPISEENRVMPDASFGNYGFLFDEKGLCIAHPKNFYISGFNPKTGKRVPPWMHQELYASWKRSGIVDAYKFLKDIPPWQNPHEFKYFSGEQVVDSGHMALDLRYSREAMTTLYGLYQITADGGSGSYQYYWDRTWKLVSAASIPYFTGRFGDSPRGFGMLCLGANMNSLNIPVIKTRNELSQLINEAYVKLDGLLGSSDSHISLMMRGLLRDVSLATLLMVFIVVFVSIWIANYLTGKLDQLIVGSREFVKGNFQYRIPISSLDEIGNLEKAFNNMASKLESNIVSQEQSRKQLIHQNLRLEHVGLFLKSLRDNSPDAILVHHTNGEVYSVNKTAEKMLGYTQDELHSMNIVDYTGLEFSQQMAMDVIHKVLEDGGFELECAFRNKQQREFPVMVRLRKILLEGEELILAFVTDITIRKHVEAQLAENRRRLMDIIEFLPDATFVIDREKKVIAWNKALEQMTLISKDEIMGKGDYAYSVPFYGIQRPILIDLIGDEDPAIMEKYDFVEKDDSRLTAEVYVPGLYGGKGAYVWVTASPLIGPDGKVYGAIESVRDITQHKIAQEALMQSEQKYRSIFSHGVMGVFQTSIEGCFISLNQTLATMLGYNNPEEVMESMTDIAQQMYFYPDRRSEIIRLLMDKGQISGYVEAFKNRKGEQWFGNLNLRIVRDGEGNFMYIEGFIEDVTDRINSESTP